MSIICDVEIQICMRSTGQNKKTRKHKQIQIFKRKGGFLLGGGKPDIHEVIRCNQYRVEVYSSYIRLGKITFLSLRHDSMIYQYNFSKGDPEDFLSLRDFAISMGGILCNKRKYNPSGKENRTSVQTNGNQVKKNPMGEYSSPVKPVSNRLRNHEETKNKQPSTIKLTNEQKAIIGAAARGKSMFFTGKAGTGKSLVLRALKKFLSGKKSAFFTATTGIAAYNIGGMTLHHFSGISHTNVSDPNELLQLCCRNKSALRRWKEVTVLVIDEISMLDGKLFDGLDYIAKRVRSTTKPFGGIQLLLCGDFFQLPPVSISREISYCFESETWKKCIEFSIELTQVFRQQTDSSYIRILNSIRIGEWTNEVERLLDECHEKYKETQEINNITDKIEICTHNSDVQKKNEYCLSQLPGRSKCFQAYDKGTIEYLKHCPASSKLYLKKHSQVILLKTISISKGLVNGAHGIILDFTKEDALPIVQFPTLNTTQVINYEEWTVTSGNNIVASRQQIPLCLAWAMSIHKCQGMTLNEAKIDLSKVFEYGQAYVALSRVASLKGLTLLGKIDKRRIQAHPKVCQFYRNLETIHPEILCSTPS